MRLSQRNSLSTSRLRNVECEEDVESKEDVETREDFEAIHVGNEKLNELEDLKKMWLVMRNCSTSFWLVLYQVQYLLTIKIHENKIER